MIHYKIILMIVVIALSSQIVGKERVPNPSIYICPDVKSRQIYEESVIGSCYKTNNKTVKKVFWGREMRNYYIFPFSNKKVYIYMK